MEKEDPKKSNLIVKKTGKKISLKIEEPKARKVKPEKEKVPEKKRVQISSEVAIRERLTDPFRVKQLCEYKRIPYI